MSWNIKRKVTVSLVVLGAAAAAGGAYAATQSNTDPRKAFLDDVAKRLHVTPDQVTGAMKASAIDQLNAAVAAGKLTQAEANAIKQRIQQGAGAGGGPLFFGGHEGPGGAGGPGFFRGGHHFGGPGTAGDDPISAAAKYLGLTDQKLFDQLSSGKSLAAVAKAQGKSVDGLKSAMTAAIKSRLDKAVAAKRLTSAQEQQMLGQVSSQLDQEINETHHGGGPGSGREHGPRGGMPHGFLFGSGSAAPSQQLSAGPYA